MLIVCIGKDYFKEDVHRIKLARWTDAKHTLNTFSDKKIVSTSLFKQAL